MSINLDIVSYADSPEEFLSSLSESGFTKAPTPEQFELESQYRKSIAGDDFENVSFCIKKNNTVEAIILSHYENDSLTYNCFGIDIIYRSYNKNILDLIFETLNNISLKFGFKNFTICDNAVGNTLSDIGQLAYNYGGRLINKFAVCIDLTQDLELIRRNVRKSYKSLINQGEREIDFQTINQDNPDKEKFDNFREFHKKIAGRTTRPIESWNAQFEMIKSGCAELIIGTMDPHGMVSSSFCIDHGDTTHYGVAVYDRSLFDKPLGHSNVYKSIVSAKERGQKTFNMGVIFQKQDVSDKEYNIGMFKKGFCDKLSHLIEWEIPTEG